MLAEVRPIRHLVQVVEGEEVKVEEDTTVTVEVQVKVKGLVVVEDIPLLTVVVDSTVGEGQWDQVRAPDGGRDRAEVPPHLGLSTPWGIPKPRMGASRHLRLLHI